MPLRVSRQIFVRRWQWAVHGDEYGVKLVSDAGQRCSAHLGEGVVLAESRTPESSDALCGPVAPYEKRWTVVTVLLKWCPQ